MISWPLGLWQNTMEGAASDRDCSVVLGEQKHRTNQDRASDEKAPRTGPSDPPLSAMCHLPKFPDLPKTVLSV